MRIRLRLFEERNTVCVFIYENDAETNDNRLNKPRNIDYLNNNRIYLLRIDNKER